MNSLEREQLENLKAECFANYAKHGGGEPGADSEAFIYGWCYNKLHNLLEQSKEKIMPDSLNMKAKLKAINIVKVEGTRVTMDFQDDTGRAQKFLEGKWHFVAVEQAEWDMWVHDKKTFLRLGLSLGIAAGIGLGILFTSIAVHLGKLRIP